MNEAFEHQLKSLNSMQAFEKQKDDSSLDMKDKLEMVGIFDILVVREGSELVNGLFLNRGRVITWYII